MAMAAEEAVMAVVDMAEVEVATVVGVAVDTAADEEATAADMVAVVVDTVDTEVECSSFD